MEYILSKSLVDSLSSLSMTLSIGSLNLISSRILTPLSTLPSYTIQMYLLIINVISDVVVIIPVILSMSTNT